MESMQPGFRTNPNFDGVNFEKTDSRFDIRLDEKKVQLKEDRRNGDIIAYGFGEYHEIRDFPIRGRATYLHVCKRKWLDKSDGKIFSYDRDLSEHDGTRLNAEFVAFLKEGDCVHTLSISILAARNALNGQTLRKQYKDVISGYRCSIPNNLNMKELWFKR